jgi:hypothetical protein
LEQIETLLCFLERLSDAKRSQVINQACRTLPTLSHYFLGWNESQAGALEQLLVKVKGMTIIQSSDNSASFLVTAFGHSNCRLGRDARPTCGIDHRATDRFVPVPDVVYLENPLENERIREAIGFAWNKFRKVTDHLVLLNGCLGFMKEGPPELSALAKCCHVIVGEQTVDVAAKFHNCGEVPCHVVNARQERDGRIIAHVQSL